MTAPASCGPIREIALLIDDARKTGMEIDPVTGEEAETLVARLLKTPEDQARRMRALLQAE